MDRLQTVLAMPEAAGRRALAQHLATMTTMTPDQIRATLAKAPEDPLAQARDVASRLQATAPGKPPTRAGRVGAAPKVDGTPITEASHPHLCAAYPFLAAAAKTSPIVLNVDQIRDMEARAGAKGSAGGHGPAPDAAGSDVDLDHVDSILAHYRGATGRGPRAAAKAIPPARAEEQPSDRPEGLADESDDGQTEALLERLRAQGKLSARKS